VTGTPRVHVFPQGLKDMGYVEGENVTMEARWARGQFDQLPALAAELVRGGPRSALAAKAATRTIPVVFVGADNPVRFDLVASLILTGWAATPRA
jgi:putative tryptophan/tyrosine transport system substrate-binding protein